MIDEYDKRLKSGGKVDKTKLAEFFNVPRTTLNTVLKNRDNILERTEAGTSFGFRIKDAKYQEVNDCVLTWFKQLLGQKIPCDGPMIQAKALDFAQRLNVEGFKASPGK